MIVKQVISIIFRKLLFLLLASKFFPKLLRIFLGKHLCPKSKKTVFEYVQIKMILSCNCSLKSYLWFFSYDTRAI